MKTKTASENLLEAIEFHEKSARNHLVAVDRLRKAQAFLEENSEVIEKFHEMGRLDSEDLEQL